MSTTTSLTALRATLDSRFGKRAVMTLDENGDPIAVLRSGSALLDEALGVGGYPRGRIIEIMGPEAAGKTTLALHAIAECQRAGGVAAFVDAEHALDVGYAKAIGVDVSTLLVTQPDSAEQALEIVDVLTRSGAVALVVVDSVAALAPQAEIDGDVGDSHRGLRARLMSQALRKLCAAAHRSGCALVFTNQLYRRAGVIFGNPETTPGGHALKFYASVRLEVRRIGAVQQGEVCTGSKVRAKVLKNKCAAPFAQAEITIAFGKGIQP